MLEDYSVDYGTVTYGCAPNLPAEVLPAPSLAQVQQFQGAVAEAIEAGQLAPVEIDLDHMFVSGMYVRTCRIPAGVFCAGKQHRHEHPVFLMRGTVRINTDKGMETITGPCLWKSEEHAKRALYTFTDCEFVTVHLNPTDTQDLEQIEADVIVPEPLLTQEKPAMFKDELQEMYA